MKVIIGLGNPGTKYQTTRHNIGFLYLDWLSKKISSTAIFSEKNKLKAEIAEINKTEKILLAKPTTFMNLSGESFQAIKNFYKLENSDFLIIYDDIDLDFNNSRFREKGSAGTHNGMRSIIQYSGSIEVPRLRLGVANEFMKNQALSDFVLSDFSKDEQNSLLDFFESTTPILQKLEII